MQISLHKYQDWQNKLTARKLYRWFWLWWGIYSVLLVFLAGAYLLLTNQAKIVLLALMAFILARIIISPLIFYFYKKQRPYQKLNFQAISSRFFSPVNKRFGSFPSDHALSFASITTVIFWYSPILGIILIVTTLFNGYGRIVLGYHYISDILAGWAIGIVSGMAVVYWLAPRLFTR